MFLQRVGIGESVVKLTAEECRLLAEVCHKSDVGVMNGRDEMVVAMGTTFSLLAVLGYSTELLRLGDYQELLMKIPLVAFNGTQSLTPLKMEFGKSKYGYKAQMRDVKRSEERKRRKRAAGEGGVTDGLKPES
jgi:hypothetical protein